MDNKLTFLELPLDRDLYKTRKISGCDKPPLRILITEAGTKTARHLMYKICSGEVFGPDQPVILHLVNARGCVNHKATLLDLEECGFPVLKDSVVIADAEKSYSKVDIVVLVALFEELSGHSLYNAFLCQLNKTRIVVRNMTLHAKPDVKLVICSPSTKGIAVLLACLRVLEPQIKTNHTSGVVFLDETIAKALVAAHLRTTTDKIKNIVIWGATCPDILNATVNTYPPDDRANIQKKDIPVMKVIENQKWIYSDFIPRIYRRVLGPELVKHGTAVASATAKHLKVLYEGSDSQEEIVSMGVIVPPSEPCGLPKNIGFSVPVVTKDGVVTVREDIKCTITTELIKMRSLFNFQNDLTMHEIYKLIKFIKEFEETTKKDFLWSQHTYLTERVRTPNNYMKYIISPRLDEPSSLEEKEVSSKKSITWEEAHLSVKSSNKHAKSSLRFNLQKQNSL